LAYFCLARGLHASLGQGRSMPRGRALPCLRCRGWARQKLFPTGRRGQALWWRHGGLGEAEIAARAAYLARDLSEGSGRTEVGFRLRATDTPSAPLASWFYQCPYDGALADVQGVIFRHPLGTLVYWYPTYFIWCRVVPVRILLFASGHCLLSIFAFSRLAGMLC
jgi:hypothetical protein